MPPSRRKCTPTGGPAGVGSGFGGVVGRAVPGRFGIVVVSAGALGVGLLGGATSVGVGATGTGSLGAGEAFASAGAGAAGSPTAAVCGGVVGTSEGPSTIGVSVTVRPP